MSFGIDCALVSAQVKRTPVQKIATVTTPRQFVSMCFPALLRLNGFAGK
jgi:hypothetical protein